MKSMSLNALTDFLTQTPEGQRRMRDTFSALAAMPKPVRREIRVERDFLQARHPRLDGGALAYAAALRIAAGATRHNQAERDTANHTERGQWIAEARARRATLAALLSREGAACGADAWPFRRHVEPEALGDAFEAWALRAVLDCWPRPLWAYAERMAALWPDAAWAKWDALRERLAARHAWLVHPEGDALAWRELEGDLSLVSFPGEVAKAAQAARRVVADVAREHIGRMAAQGQDSEPHGTQEGATPRETANAAPPECLPV